MSLTFQQADQLGVLIANARLRKGLSLRGLAGQLRVGVSWLAELEGGKYLDPAPERLAQLAEALDIEPSLIDELTSGAVSEGLPEARTYFRAKYDLSPADTEKVERYIARLRRRG